MTSSRLRVPALLLAAFAMLLVFAATAAAETRTGETNGATPLFGTTSPEATLVKSSASYDTGGSVNFTVTTAAAPQVEEGPGEPSETKLLGALFTVPSECTFPVLVAGGYSPSILLIQDQYKNPTSAEALVVPTISTTPDFTGAEPVAKTVSGTTTTLALTASKLANQGYNCALVETVESGGGDLTVFPLKTVVTSPPPPAPVPAPPALSIAKAKPLKLKVGKSRTVKVKVTNTGATATAQGSLRVKPVKGVLVKPEVQKLPVLAPGASWTVSVRVQLTAKAKPKSTLAVTGTASGVSAKSSLVLKLKQ